MNQPNNQNNPCTRRQFVIGAGVLSAGAAMLSPNLIPGNVAVAAANPRQHALRFCHLTDTHLFGERNAAKGLAQLLEHLNKLDPRPQLIVTGGDNIMDAFETPEDNVRSQFALLKKTFADHTDIPIRHCLGNHDIWGWNKSKSHTTGSEPNWGTRWALKEYGMDNEYYTFDRAGWRFIILQTVQIDPRDANGYVGGLGNTQYAWLEKLLDDTPDTMPVVTVGHIPILSVCDFQYGKTQDYNHMIPHGHVCGDASKLIKLFAERQNVKLCLSGHMHQLDNIEFRGTRYICDGAVCGAWWKGANGPFEEGCGLIDLYDDGTFQHRYIDYGWKV